MKNLYLQRKYLKFACLHKKLLELQIGFSRGKGFFTLLEHLIFVSILRIHFFLIIKNLIDIVKIRRIKKYLASKRKCLKFKTAIARNSMGLFFSQNTLTL